jgi:hypothetical protein
VNGRLLVVRAECATCTGLVHEEPIMRHAPTLTRRAAVLMLGAGTLMPRRGIALERPAVRVHKDPNCGCCNGWVTHLRRAGYDAAGVDTNRLNAVKARLGVPPQLHSCHTAEVGDFVVEGHVPASAIDRLLAERPQARGLAVPGMPVGSPGMEGGEPETYDVILFGPQGTRVFLRYRGARVL